MSSKHITFRKVVLAAGLGIVGAALGGVFAKVVVSSFANCPSWLLPAIAVGTLAALVIAALIIPTIIDGRCRAKRRASAPR